MNIFRPCVGCVLLNSEGSIFVGQRGEFADFGHKSGWQMPQGGINKGEPIKDALFRELNEEIGTNNVTVLGFYDKWLLYEFPKGISNCYEGYVGQKQKWFLCRFEGDDNEIDISYEDLPEFVNWKWVSPQSVIDGIVKFKKDVYVEVLQHFLGFGKS